MAMVVKRTEIWLVDLNPTIGKEIQKTRPCMIISPNEANKYLDTVIIAPLTSTKRGYPSRINCLFENKEGQIAIDQIRSIDKARLVKRLGVMDKNTSSKVFMLLQEYFFH